MALPRKPQYTANLLVELGLNSTFQKLSESISAVLKMKIPNASVEEIWDYIEQFEKDIANELFLKVEESSLEGIELNFQIIEEDGEYYIRFQDRPEIELLRRLQRDTPANFEKFCKKILEKLEGKSFVSGGPYDGGIDFIAFDLKINNLPVISTLGSRIFLIGQAKRYTEGNHVTEKELREFIGAAIKRIDEFKKTRADQYGILQPTILAFWTTSDFHINAKQFAKEFGLWYLNGIGLTQLALKLRI